MLDNSSLIFLFLNAVAAVCFFTLGFARYGAFLNPITMFSGLWAVVAFGANLGLYDFFTPSVDVNWILIIGAISFCVVCWILENRNAFKVSVDHMTGENDISYNFIVVCAAVAAAFMLPLLGDAFAVILSDGGWSALRLENYNAGSTYRSTFQIYGYEYIAKPITRALVIIGLWAYLAKVQRGGLILLMGLLLSLLGTIVSAGRGDILNVIILGVFAMAMAHKKQSSSNLWQRIMRPRIVVPAIAIAVLVLAITADRHVGDTTIAETFYQYYFSGPVFLSELLRQDNLAWTVGEDYMLGWATFGFLANAPLTLGLVFGLGTQTSNYWVGSVLTSPNLQIGDGIYGNAMCTCFYDFLLDWGVAGVVLGPALLALASGLIAQELGKKNTIFWASIALLWVQVLFRTTFRWDPVDIAFTITIFFMYVFTHKGFLSKRRGADMCRTAHEADARRGFQRRKNRQRKERGRC